MSSKQFNLFSTNNIKSSAYYQALYVRRGQSGLFKDSMGCKMMQQDVLNSQRELARRLSSAIVIDDKDK